LLKKVQVGIPGSILVQLNAGTVYANGADYHLLLQQVQGTENKVEFPNPEQLPVVLFKSGVPQGKVVER
jgi:hypothetical protein